MDGIDQTKRDLLVKVAKMYYIEGHSQQFISKELNYSRSGVSRLLKACRELGIVEIKVKELSSMGVNLQNELKERFDLKHALVIPSANEIELTKNALGREAAEYLGNQLRDGMKIGLTWGSTLYHMVQYFQPRTMSKAEVFQLMGCTATKNLETDGREHARTVAEKLDARCHVLNAPLLVGNETLRQMLVQEPEIGDILDQMEDLDLAVIGLGTNDPTASHLVRIGYMSSITATDLLQEKAVGDVCGRQIDINGDLCSLHFNNRVIGIDLDHLKKTPNVIAVAAGYQKGEIILGALRGGYVNTLITDEDAANRVISLNKIH